jgi:hypothetical protein
MKTASASCSKRPVITSLRLMAFLLFDQRKARPRIINIPIIPVNLAI